MNLYRGSRFAHGDDRRLLAATGFIHQRGPPACLGRASLATGSATGRSPESCRVVESYGEGPRRPGRPQASSVSPSGKIQRGEQSGAVFRNGLLDGFRPPFRPLRRVSRKRPFFERPQAYLVRDKFKAHSPSLLRFSEAGPGDLWQLILLLQCSSTSSARPARKIVPRQHLFL